VVGWNHYTGGGFGDWIKEKYSGEGDWIQEKEIGFRRRRLDSRERLRRRS